MDSKLVLYNTLTRRKEDVRAARAGPRRHVCLRSHGLRRSASGPRPARRDVRPAVPLPQGFGLQGALRAQHHGRGPSGARRRRGRGQDRQEGPARTAGADGGGALLHGALPPGDGRAQRRDPLDRALRLGPHHRADRVREEDPRRRLRLRVRTGRSISTSRSTTGNTATAACRAATSTDIVANTRELDGQSDKRHSYDFALWKKASPEHIMRWPSPWSEGFPGWHMECSAMSTRYLGRAFRHPRRRHGPDVPAPRVRDRAVHGRARATIRHAIGCTTT